MEVKLKINIKGQDVEMTLAEAKDLLDELIQLFPARVAENPVPVYPATPAYPQPINVPDYFPNHPTYPGWLPQTWC